MFKRIVYLIIVVFFATSCADSWDSVKRGLTGAKKESSDEFLVKKKDPLVLPPDYDTLPIPDERTETEEEGVTSFEEKLSINSTTESDSSSDGSAEMSILEQIRKQ